MIFKSIHKYIKYRIDRLFNKGLVYQLIILVLGILCMLLGTSIFMRFLFNYPLEKAFWEGVNQFIATGNISAVDGHFGIVIIFLIINFVGVCVWGLLIAMINNSLQLRIYNLSKGNSFIMERNHSIILGYGEEALTIIEEFIIGRAKKIVLLSEHDADSIKKRIVFMKKHGKADIIIREGNPNIIENLKLLNIEKSHSISIINDNDTESLKILLSLKKISDESDNRHNTMNICVLLNNMESIEIIKSIEDKIFKIHAVYKYEILYKLIAQSIVYTGLSSVYEELFSYNGNDIKIEKDYNLENMKFIDASRKMLNKNEILLGFIDNKNKTLFSPGYNSLIKNKDDLIILYKNKGKENIHISSHVGIEPKYKHKVLLICNNIISSEIMEIISIYNNDSEIIQLDYSDIDNVKIKYEYLLKNINENHITKIIIISENIDTDVRAINILLIIRQIIRKNDYHIPILSLINSIENRNLIYSYDIRDFIVSGKLIGILMAHASLNPDILSVFNGLLSKNGKDIIMQKYSDHFNEPKEFMDVHLELLKKGIIVIGIKSISKIVLNPMANVIINTTDEIVVITNYDLIKNN